MVNLANYSPGDLIDFTLDPRIIGIVLRYDPGGISILWSNGKRTDLFIGDSPFVSMYTRRIT